MDDLALRPGALTRRGLLASGVAAAVMPPAARVSGGPMNPRLSIADPKNFILQPAAMIQRRFDLYKQIGIGTLRVSVGWWDQEFGDNGWRGTTRLPYFKLAVQNGFRLKMQVGTISAPPQWYMAEHPEAQMLNHDRIPSPADISYWYPDLHAVMTTKAEHLFGYLAEQNLFGFIDYVIVDCGPAGEPIYPAVWTLPPGATVAKASFWFYDVDAQANFAPAMSALYGGALDAANHAWGTSFRTWGEVKIPEPTTRPGNMWNDVLIWYRNAKRSFVAWQVANYQTLLRRYAGAAMPRLMLMVPGSHIPAAEWLDAVHSGDGGYSIKIMSDSEYLIDLAAQTGCWLQYTGVENGPEVAYLQSYMRSNGRQIPMWGENAGGPEIGNDPQRIANVIIQNQLYGFEFINSSFVFDSTGAKQSSTFSKLEHAYSTVTLANK